MSAAENEVLENPDAPGLGTNEPIEEVVDRREVIAAALEKSHEENTDEDGGAKPPVVATKTDVPGGEKTPVEPKPTDGNGKNVAPADKPQSAPASWKPAQKAKWEGIDPDVRTEIIRRERETAQVVNDNQRAREFTHSMAQVIGPHAQRFQAMGVQPMQAVERLLRADLIMSTAAPAQRAHFMAKMIKDYGIDINALDEALDPNAQPKADPNAELDRHLDKRLAPVNEELRAFRQEKAEREQQETQNMMSEVDAMEANSEKFPYFSQLRGDMADIIELSAKKGIFISTEQAYNKAIGINPEVNTANQARIQAETRRIAATADTARAQRAKRAGLSVAGSSSGSPTGTVVSPSDRRGTIAAALAAVGGR